MKKFLVVYNFCGVNSDNFDMWIDHLTSIISQRDAHFDLVISGCLISEYSKNRLTEYLSSSRLKENGEIYIDFIEELHPVNVTFNHSCIKCSEVSDYEGYLFLSSDIKILNDIDLSRMFKFHYGHNVGISNFIVDNENWIPTHISQELWTKLQNEHSDFPFGLSINCDCVIFDSLIYKTYKKLIPDIFRSWCTESTFPFICASVNKVHKCHDNSLTVHHAIDRREGSSAIAKSGCEKGCDDLYRSSRSVQERLLSEEAFLCGFGYAESHHYIHKGTREAVEKIYLVHDENAYISDYHPKDPDRLINFIDKNLYLSNEELDYNVIQSFFKKV